MRRALLSLAATWALGCGWALAQPPALEPRDTWQLSGLQDQFSKLARSVSPSVVAIFATAADAQRIVIPKNVDLTASCLQQVLGKTSVQVGTGFFISEDGYILTNDHVVGGGGLLWIVNDSGQIYPAFVVGRDQRADLAVLKVAIANALAVEFSPSEDLARGQWVLSLGNPYGLAGQGELALSVGVVSALHRQLPRLAAAEGRDYVDLIQTTAPLNPGNSGGALFDLQGRVMGVAVAVVPPQSGVNGMSFALTADKAMLRRVEELKNAQEGEYGRLGVSVADATPRQCRSAGAGVEAGVRVEAVEAAAVGKLQPGDVVVRINRRPVRSTVQFVQYLNQITPRQRVTLGYYRQGRLRQAELVLGAVSGQAEPTRWKYQGAVFTTVPQNWSDEARGGLVVAVAADSPLQKQGIACGDVITRVGGAKVVDVNQLKRLLASNPSAALSVAGRARALEQASVK